MHNLVYDLARRGLPNFSVVISHLPPDFEICNECIVLRLRHWRVTKDFKSLCPLIVPCWRLRVLAESRHFTLHHAWYPYIRGTVAALTLSY